MRFIVQFSGGVTSWAAARRLVDQHGAGNVMLLAANTNTEADDWLPFVHACQADLGCELVMLDNDGRNIWDVFQAHRFLGNSRVDVCSRELKREPLRRWLDNNADPAVDIIALGFDFDEEHRLRRAIPHWEPWRVVAPMTEEPYLYKDQLLVALQARGIPVPELYRQGFAHNNCRGCCVKAGQAQWAQTLRLRRDDYLEAERQEAALGEQIGRPVSILVDRRNLAPGEKRRPLTLRQFRERIEGGGTHDGDWGSCSCMDPS